MLHVLPSTIKKEASEDASAPGSSSYKKKKEAKDKANSSRFLRARPRALARLLLPCPHFPSRRGALAPWGSSLTITLLSPFLTCRTGELWCLAVRSPGG